MKMKKFSLAVLPLLFASSLALAHGDASSAKNKFDASAMEQMTFGIAGDPAAADRTIRIAMDDSMRFTPGLIKVRQGETIRFVVTNKGKIMHEAVIGSMQELKQHSAMMKKFPTMEHEAPYMAHVKPGQSQEIVWTFNQPGDFYFACLIAGHFEAGMVGKITVTAKN